MYPITKGVTLPPPPRRLGNIPKYPWPDLEVGDSFKVDYDDRPNRTPDQILNSLINAGTSWSDRNHNGERKFTARQRRTGVRVWRTE